MPANVMATPRAASQERSRPASNKHLLMQKLVTMLGSRSVFLGPIKMYPANKPKSPTPSPRCHSAQAKTIATRRRRQHVTQQHNVGAYEQTNGDDGAVCVDAEKTYSFPCGSKQEELPVHRNAVIIAAVLPIRLESTFSLYTIAKTVFWL